MAFILIDHLLSVKHCKNPILVLNKQEIISIFNLLFKDEGEFESLSDLCSKLTQVVGQEGSLDPHSLRV
jgi:hypothetical protein